MTNCTGSKYLSCPVFTSNTSHITGIVKGSTIMIHILDNTIQYTIHVHVHAHVHVIQYTVFFYSMLSLLFDHDSLMSLVHNYMYYVHVCVCVLV